VTPHFVQAAFGLKNCDRRLKFCMQHLNVIIHTNQEHNLGSEVNDLNFKIGKLPIASHELIHKKIKRVPTKTQIFDLRFDLFSIMLSNMSRSKYRD